MTRPARIFVLSEEKRRTMAELETAKARNAEQEYQRLKRNPNFPELKIEDNQDKTDWRKLPTLITV